MPTVPAASRRPYAPSSTRRVPFDGAAKRRLPLHVVRPIRSDRTIASSTRKGGHVTDTGKRQRPNLNATAPDSPLRVDAASSILDVDTTKDTECKSL